MNDTAQRGAAFTAAHAMLPFRLTEQARKLAAEQRQVSPRHLLLAAAGMPETAENARLADYDEGRVQFTFRCTNVSMALGHTECRAVPGTDRDG